MHRKRAGGRNVFFPRPPVAELDVACAGARWFKHKELSCRPARHVSGAGRLRGGTQQPHRCARRARELPGKPSPSLHRKPDVQLLFLGNLRASAVLSLRQCHGVVLRRRGATHPRDERDTSHHPPTEIAHCRKPISCWRFHKRRFLRYSLGVTQSGCISNKRSIEWLKIRRRAVASLAAGLPA